MPAPQQTSDQGTATPWERGGAPLLFGHELAGRGHRLGAFLVDAGVALVLTWTVLAVLLAAGLSVGRTAHLLLLVAAWVLTTAVASGLNDGKSVGKALAGVRVVRGADGSGAGFWLSFFRDSVCRLLYVIPFFGPLDCLWPLGHERKALRDKIVDTQVVSEPDWRSRRGRLVFGLPLLAASMLGLGVAVEALN
jgi:uncharacterized RDD family membrane protein YckC